MQKLMSLIMFFLVFILGLYLLFHIITEVSWKLYSLIYSTYLWGLLFPNAKYSSIVTCVVISVIVVFLCILKIISKLHRKTK